MWNAIGEYADGTRVEKNFLYNEGGNYNLECERQYDLECCQVVMTRPHLNRWIITAKHTDAR